jgi:hypothetical protein
VLVSDGIQVVHVFGAEVSGGSVVTADARPRPVTSAAAPARNFITRFSFPPDLLCLRPQTWRAGSQNILQAQPGRNALCSTGTPARRSVHADLVLGATGRPEGMPGRVLPGMPAECFAGLGRQLLPGRDVPVLRGISVGCAFVEVES